MLIVQHAACNLPEFGQGKGVSGLERDGRGASVGCSGRH